MARFFLIRHGLNDETGQILSARKPGLHLNATGREQAQRVAMHLAREPIRAIYSSPMERTQETAQPLAEKLGLEVQIDEGLNEFHFGDWTGCAFDAVDQIEERQRFNHWRGGIRPPGGELALEMQARTVAAILHLSARHGPDNTVACFTHADPIRAVIAHFTSMPIDLYHRLEISPASLSIVEVGDWGPRILGLNLPIGEQHWPG